MEIIPSDVWSELRLVGEPGKDFRLQGSLNWGGAQDVAEWKGWATVIFKKSDLVNIIGKASRHPEAAEKITKAAYRKRVEDSQKSTGRNPPLQTTKDGTLGDREWAMARGVSRADIANWRSEMMGPQPRGRPTEMRQKK